MDVRELAPSLESRLPATLDLLKQMVDLNSWTENRDGVNRLGRLTADAFANLGFTAEFVPSVNPVYGDHLFLWRPGNSSKSVALVAHLDTVFPPDEEARNDFRWRPEGDRIYGPGTEDIKGGTALMWLVLHGLRERDPAAFDDVNWRLCWNSSEEVLSADFGQLCRQRLGPERNGGWSSRARGAERGNWRSPDAGRMPAADMRPGPMPSCSSAPLSKRWPR